MDLRSLFLKANNEPETTGRLPRGRHIVCPGCNRKVAVSRVRREFFVCPACGRYFTVRARRRILMLTDRRSFTEHDRDMTSRNVLHFPEYEAKLEAARMKSRETEGVITGEAAIDGHPVCIFSMDANFMMGSMGSVVGEKITRLFEYATARHLPVIGVTVSGGARMQEGMLSLMQMSKVSAAVKRHGNAGNLYIVLLTDPTTGGVDASFAMQGDITLAEPGARVGFAGPRVIEKSLNQALPKDFQRAERVLSCGFIDAIVPRSEQRQILAKLLKLHERTAR
ncbi:MAG: acetyl-CoA carboxylase carboxyl transferase subunit beta [Lachnospiraceae bacterium]|nr:acetyl-CoA carboxylase carboxyl transferase subunit beta [Lachnospiraceae bacterium]